MKQVGHLRQTVQPARGSEEIELALLKRVSENARPVEKERERPKRSKKQVYSAM